MAMALDRVSALRNRRSAIFAGCCLIVAVLAVYSPVGSYDFINLDDNEYVTENPFVRGGINAENVRWAFTAFHSGHWHPLTWLSLALDCTLFGATPGALHLVNVVLHAANAALLFSWLAAATGSARRSAVVAALFALHPLRVESVAWVTERKDVLSGCFLMLTLWAYVGYCRKPTLWRYTQVIAGFACALLAKPVVVTVPFMFLLLDFWPLGRHRRVAAESSGHDAGRWRSLAGLLLEKIPFLLLGLATLAVTVTAQRAAGAAVSNAQLPLDMRVEAAAWNYLAYIGKTLWPVDLAVFYPLHPVPAWRGALGGLAIAVLTLLAYRLRARRPYVLMGWLWFLVTLLPVIGLVQFGGQGIADRFTYIPHIGLFVLAVWTLADLSSERTAACGAAVVLCLCVVITSWQLRFWRDSITLFTRALAVTSDNFMAHNNLGVELAARGDAEAAERHYAEAVRINPTWPEAQNNLGMAYAVGGDYARARGHFEQALRVRPQFAVAENNLATALAFEGNFDAAVEHYTRAVQFMPAYVDARYALADALERTGHLEQAAQEYQRVIEERPGWPPAQQRLQRVTAALQEGTTATLPADRVP